MKLTALYSNKEDVFPTINFNEGLNVIFAKVELPTTLEADSHNLGKTFLITVIDFCLLTTVTRDHVFKKQEDRFKAFTFYLELQTLSGDYVTVKRKVKSKQDICIHVSKDRGKHLQLPENRWTLNKLGVSKARDELNGLLNLTALGTYGYRKGLGYILRRQSDYNEVFKISKFVHGADSDWKPFMATLLGLPSKQVKEKYKVEKQIANLTDAKKVIEKETGSQRKEIDRLQAEIEVRAAELEKQQAEIARFNFADAEREINENLVADIESQLARLNKERYLTSFELQEIDQTLSKSYNFDIDRVVGLFSEAEIAFPDDLKRNYDELIEFNRKLTEGREERLSNRRAELEKMSERLEAEIDLLSKQRQEAHALLAEQKTLGKYEKLQRRILNRERDILGLRQKVEQLTRVSDIEREIASLRSEADDLAAKIEASIIGHNPTYANMRRTFGNYVKRVLNLQALLFTEVNNNGNLEFVIKTIDPGPKGAETSEGKGTSYRKMLCACFDLALLSVHASDRFYRFVYHDGIFEGLDNRKKVSFLALVRELCATKNLQYNLTVIDTDLPRNPDDDQRLLFESPEIVRQLHDKDDSGRLFRMPAF